VVVLPHLSENGSGLLELKCSSALHCVADEQSVVSDAAVKFTQSSDNGPTAEASDLLRSVFLRCGTFVLLHFHSCNSQLVKFPAPQPTRGSGFGSFYSCQKVTDSNDFADMMHRTATLQHKVQK